MRPTEEPTQKSRSGQPLPEVLRLADVMDLTKLSRTTLWRLQRRGQFPGSFAISPGLKGWLREDVERWLERASSRATSADA